MEMQMYCALFRVVPRIPDPHPNPKRNLERKGIVHGVFDYFTDGFDVLGWTLEHQFVMDLQEHSCAKRLELRLEVDHGVFDDAGAGALNRHVDRGTFGGFAHGKDF